MTEYYDLVLGLIPLAVLGLGGGLQVAGFAQTTAVTLGGLIGVGLVLHAMFVRAPTADSGSTSGKERNTIQAPTAD